MYGPTCVCSLKIRWKNIYLKTQKLLIFIIFKHYFANKGPSSQCYGFSSGKSYMDVRVGL